MFPEQAIKPTNLAALLLASTPFGCGGVTPIAPESDTDGFEPVIETGGFDTGEVPPEADGTAADEPVGWCYTENDELTNGYVYQCEGSASITLEYDNGIEPFNIEFSSSKEFGNAHEPYHLTPVSACCNVLNEDIVFEETAHFDACHQDFAIFACSGIKNVLLQASQNDPSNDDDVANDLEVIIPNLLDVHTCAEFLYDQIAPPGPSTGSSTETIQLAIAGNGTQTDSVTEVQAEIVWQIDDVYFPSDPNDELGCDSYQTNDDAQWSKDPETPDFEGEAATIDVDLDGPTYLGGAVTATGRFSDSRVALSEVVNNREWRLEKMLLPTSTAITVGNSTATVRVERFRVELAMPTGNLTGDADDFTASAGDALFFVMGHGDGIPYAISVYNATDIEFSYNGFTGEWTSNAFDLEFEDPDGDTWTLEIDSDSWS